METIREKVLPARLDVAGANTEWVMNCLDSGKAKVVSIPVSELKNMLSWEEVVSKKDAA